MAIVNLATRSPSSPREKWVRDNIARDVAMDALAQFVACAEHVRTTGCRDLQA